MAVDHLLACRWLGAKLPIVSLSLPQATIDPVKVTPPIRIDSTM
jgi:hypothetical protein